MFHLVDIGDSGIGFDIDAGNDQHFQTILLHGNTTNFDDEVGDHHYNDIRTEAPMQLLPDNFAGINVSASTTGGDIWGVDTVVLASGTRDKPFKVIGMSAEADDTEKFRLRLSDDRGLTHFT
ncbi:unnamed protein product, partial [marine sediment metagenome]